MLRAFGFHDSEDPMKRHSVEGDGQLSKEALIKILETYPLAKPDYCLAIRTKVKSCPTQAVLKCGAYLFAAESLCNAGVPNMVEKCIMSESCDNVCKRINAVEDAAHGSAMIVYQEVVSLDQLGIGYPECGLQAWQGPQLVLGLLIWTIIEVVVGTTAAYIDESIVRFIAYSRPTRSS
ncbi:hypothetical protein FRC12_003045 [Ceratobasidium sp. 428]|nr:hypothetical protein FRC12_003045 [Ceratobasidium sp. 428]